MRVGNMSTFGALGQVEAAHSRMGLRMDHAAAAGVAAAYDHNRMGRTVTVCCTVGARRCSARAGPRPPVISDFNLSL